MTPLEPNRHDKAADAVHEGRPVEAQYVRGGRRNPRMLVLLLLSTGAVAILLLGMWLLSNSGFKGENQTASEQAAQARTFDDAGSIPSAAEAPARSTDNPSPAPAGQTPN